MTEEVDLGALAAALYALGRIVFALGVLFCLVGVVAAPIEELLQGRPTLWSWSAIAQGVGGQTVGYGALAICLSRLSEAREALRFGDRHIPLFKNTASSSGKGRSE